MINIGNILSSPLIGIIGMVVPQAAPIIAILQRFAPAISAVQPVIEAAVKEGKPAFDAAIAKAPELRHAVTEIFHKVPSLSDFTSSFSADQPVPTKVVWENITRMLGGQQMMDPAEEARLMEAATPNTSGINDPLASQRGGG